MRAVALLIFCCFCIGSSAQTAFVPDVFKIRKEEYIRPTTNNLFFLMENVDLARWSQVLLPLGFQTKGLNERHMGLHFVKGTDDAQFELITYDTQFGVLTLNWIDRSGKIFFSETIKKQLKSVPQQNIGGSMYYTLINGSKKYTLTVNHNESGRGVEEEFSLEFSR